MPGLKIVCPICTDEFQGSDDIYSTSCGHLYHYSCMMQWQSRSTSCPQCRQHNPSKHKIFLNIEDAGQQEPTAPPVDEDLKVKLESSCDKIQELQDLLMVSELNFLHLQEQYTAEKDARNELEQRIAQDGDNEENFLNLHAQYSESEDRLKTLREEKETLVIENEYKAKELDIRAKEIDFLKDSLAMAKPNSLSDTAINAKVDVLEQRLKLVYAELQKEISNGTQLAVEKIKLQSYIKRLEAQSSPANINGKLNIGKYNMKNNPLAKSTGEMQRSKENNSNLCLNIFNLPLKGVKPHLSDTVIDIGKMINVDISREDIEKTTIKQKRRRTPGHINICVNFTNADAKTRFLANRALIRMDETFGKIDIKEFIDEKLQALFTYANTKLRGKVFGFIVCVNNTIVANKRRGDGKDIIIHSKEQVDKLLSEQMSLKNEPTVYLETDRCDESFYKV